MDAARKTDADAFEGLICVPLAHGLHRIDHPSDGTFRVGDDRHGLLREKPSIEVDDRDKYLQRSQVRNNDHKFIVQREQCRTAASRATNDGSFHNPLFGEQLLNNR